MKVSARTSYFFISNGKYTMVSSEKSITTRLNECVNIRKQMVDLGIDHLEDLDELKHIMSTFVKDAIPASGKLYSKTMRRYIQYQFSTKEGRESFCRLVAEKH